MQADIVVSAVSQGVRTCTVRRYRRYAVHVCIVQGPAILLDLAVPVSRRVLCLCRTPESVEVILS